MTLTKSAFTAALMATVAMPALAEGQLNLYSSRHYDTDERLYSDFTEQTGITINRIEGKADELLARMEAEGANSPADVLITVDTSRLSRAKEMGLLQSVDSDILEERIPSNLQDADNDWFGFSQRARIIFYSKDAVDNQTLLAALVTHHGEEKATEWAQGVVNNMARAPQGGDTDQLRGLVSGECEISVSNSYYFARAIRTEVDGLSADLDKIGLVFPDQEGNGAHMNLSGAGVAANAPNRDNAVKFLEYLSSDSAQSYFSAGNDEFPAVEGVELADSVEKLGEFKADEVNLSEVAKNIPTAQKIFNAVGWE